MRRSDRHDAVKVGGAATACAPRASGVIGSVRETISGLRRIGVTEVTAGKLEAVCAGPVAPSSDPPPDERRSRLMARVRQRDTKPEMAVRRAAHAMGFRFRLQRRDLPGRPDLVFPRLKKALFVHGCFWHSHDGCKWATVPKTRTEYWDAKLATNRARDERVEHALSEQGWDVGVIWECETRKQDVLSLRLRAFLQGELGYAGEPTGHGDSVTTESET